MYNSNKWYDDESDMIMQGQKLNKANTFKYLGSTVAEDGDLDKDITCTAVNIEQLVEWVGRSVWQKSNFTLQLIQNQLVALIHPCRTQVRRLVHTTDIMMLLNSGIVRYFF